MSEHNEEQKLPAISSIKVDQTNGRFLPATFEDTFRLARMYVQSKMLPQRYQTPEMVVTAMQYAAELGITGITALRQIAVINGTPTLFGDLPLAVVRGRGMLEKIEEYLVTADGTRICLKNKNLNAEFYAAVCILKRKGEEEREFVYTVDDAKKAELWGRNVWKPHPKRMIQMRTRGWGVKDVFGDLLNGCAQGEYDFDTIIEVASEIDGKPASGLAKINALAVVPPVVKEQNPSEQAPPVAPAKEPEVLPAESAPAAAEAKPAEAEQGSFESFQATTVVGASS